MNEMMDFPNTFEEFAEQYGFKDKKEIYTNGSMLIPVNSLKKCIKNTKSFSGESMKMFVVTI